MSADTSRDAVERLADLCEQTAILVGQRRAAATLRALLAERDALQRELDEMRDQYCTPGQFGPHPDAPA